MVNILHTFLLPFLIPLSWIYGIIIWIRNYFFDIGLFKSHKFKKPIISIGNLTMGGTGKTPLVIYLAKYIKNNGKTPGIVSRGYNRESNGLVTVHDGNKLLVNVNTAGDEAYLLGMELKNIPIIVSEDRAKGIRVLLENNIIDIVILDDAFQHRRIKRNIDIAMFSAFEKPQYYHLLPWGKLREPLYNIKRAHYIIYSNTKKFENPLIHNSLIKYMKNVPATTIMKPVLMKINDVGRKKVNSINETVFAFCGIGSPNSFFSLVEELDINISGKKVFLDHEKYTTNTLKKLLQEIENTNCKAVVTTEKDIIKIPENFIRKFQFYIIKIEIIFENDTLIKNLVKQAFFI